MSQQFCVDQGRTLATHAQMCPHGAGVESIFGGQKEGDQWSPCADYENCYVQVGTREWGNECRTHREMFGNPGWGTGGGQEAYESRWVLCAF